MNGDDEPAVPDQPEALEVRWGEDSPSPDPEQTPVARRLAVSVPRPGTTARTSFLYLDCGAWMGDGRHEPSQRSFAVVAGRHAVLCEFQAGRGVPAVRNEDASAQAITRLVAALAGPQRMDVTVRRWCVAQTSTAADDGEVRVFLPDMHLPLVGRMPDLEPDLVPDPLLARCWCHGPIFARIDQAAAAGTARKAVYRAIGSRLTRSPNDWFYAMASSYRSAAEDLVRFLDRLTRHAVNADVHLVHLGGLFDVWAGYKCVFHSMGFAGLLEPRIVAGAGERAFVAKWRDATLDGRPKDAIARLYRIAPERRTILSAPHGHFASSPPASQGLPPELQTSTPEIAPASFRTPSILAESRPEPVGCCVDKPPHALVGMLEGKAQFFPWTRARPAGWRGELVAAAARRWAEQPFSTYVMAHTHVPCLAEVFVDPD